MKDAMNIFQAEDFAGCTTNECQETEWYLEAKIKAFKESGHTGDMMYCLSHLSAIRLALLEKSDHSKKKAK